MAVFRVERTGDYTVMSNFHLKDKRLSLKDVYKRQDWTRGSGTVFHPARDDVLHMGYGKAGAVFLLARERFVSTLKHRSFQIAHGPDGLCGDHRKTFFTG